MSLAEHLFHFQFQRPFAPAPAYIHLRMHWKNILIKIDNINKYLIKETYC